MKRLEVIIKRHDQQMFTHHKIHLAGRAPLHNDKIWNETIRALEGWREQQCEQQSENDDE